MKNRRLLTILIIFIIIGSFAVLGSALFAVRTVDIQFTNEFDFFKGEEQQQLVTNLRTSVLPITKGRNILFGINRDKVKTTLEDANTRVRVMNIEAKFPNRLEIIVRERYPVYKFKVGTQTAVMCGYLRVLDILSDGEFAVFEAKLDWPLIEIPDEISTELDFNSLKVGEYLSDLEIESEHVTKIKVLQEIAPFFARIETNEDAICHIFESISINDDFGELRLIMTSRTEARNGTFLQNYFEFIIWNPENRLKDKLIKGWMAVEEKDTAPGAYQVWEQEYTTDKNGQQVKVTDGILVVYQSA